MLNQPSAQLALVTAAAAIALGITGILSSTGRAQTGGGPRTLHYVATETGGFEAHGRFGNGSVNGCKDRLKADDGTTGHDVGVCVITDLKHKEAFCHMVAVFPGGQLFLESFPRESSKHRTAAVVGGTGSYAGAHGYG